jgi:hypothetical protein
MPQSVLTPFLSESIVWSAKIVENLYKNLAYVAAFTNRDYEGEARQGGTVRIFRTGGVAVTPYAGPWVDADWQNLSDSSQDLQISQGRKFLFQLPDVNEAFTAIRMIEKASAEAAYSMGDAIDQWIAARLLIEANTAPALGTAAAPLVIGMGAGQMRPLSLIHISEPTRQVR